MSGLIIMLCCQRIVLILAEELDPQSLDDQFRMQMKMNKSISVKDSKFWEKLR